MKADKGLSVPRADAGLIHTRNKARSEDNQPLEQITVKYVTGSAITCGVSKSRLGVFLKDLL